VSTRSTLPPSRSSRSLKRKAQSSVPDTPSGKKAK
jgi:hypothetical protein